MATFDVDVQGVTYEVDAPDERTAWRWANATHAKQTLPKQDIAAKVASDPISQGAREQMESPFLKGSNRQVLLTGRHGLEAFGGGVIADKLGLPRPEGATERVVGDVSRTMAGAGLMGGIAGKVAPMVQGIPQKIAEMLAAAPGLTQASAAGAGAGGGIARESGAGPTGQFAASLAGGLVPGIPQVLAPVGRLGRNVVDPWLHGGVERMKSRTLNQAAGGKRNALIAALKQNESIVPGSPTTAGEVAAPVGSTEFNALQEVVRPRAPTAYDAIAQAQNAARLGAVRSVGQDEAALTAALAKRGANAGANYGAAYSQLTRANQALMQLMENPFIKDELPAALKLAEANGITPKTDLTEFLHYVKIGLDKSLSKTGNDALSSTQRKATQDAKTELVAWMKRANPGYDKARSVFAAESKPINQMEIGQYLEGKLTPAIADQGALPSQRSALYAQALRDAPGTIKRATGQPRYDTLAEPLTQSQLKSVEGVGAELGRAAEHTRLAQLGMPKARELLGQEAPKVPAAGMFSPHYSVARAVLNRLSGRLNDKALDSLARDMQNAPEVARIMELTTPQAQKQALANTLVQRALLAASIRQSQGYTGVLSQQHSEQQGILSQP